jgi:hypothetical protein
MHAHKLLWALARLGKLCNGDGRGVAGENAMIRCDGFDLLNDLPIAELPSTGGQTCTQNHTHIHTHTHTQWNLLPTLCLSSMLSKTASITISALPNCCQYEMGTGETKAFGPQNSRNEPSNSNKATYALPGGRCVSQAADLRHGHIAIEAVHHTSGPRGAERRICAAQEHISTQQKQKQSKGTHAVIFFFLTSVLRFFSIWPRPRPRPARSESCVSAAKSSEISSCTGAGKTHRLLQTKQNREIDSRADLEKDIVALLDAHLCDTSAHQAGA